MESHEKLEIAREALREISKGLDGDTPVGNPWNFYQDLVDFAAQKLEEIEGESK